MARCRAPGHLLHLTIKRITSHAPHVDHPFCILRHIGAQELSDVPCCQQDDLKRHLNGMRDKIAFYRSEKQKASADAATAVPMAAQGHSPSPIPVHMQHSTSNTSFASLSSSPTIFTSPSPVLHHSPANIQTDIQKPVHFVVPSQLPHNCCSGWHDRRAL